LSGDLLPLQGNQSGNKVGTAYAFVCHTNYLSLVCGKNVIMSPKKSLSF
jgi:hypothetical protein